MAITTTPQRSKTVIWVASFVGLAVSAYLTYIKFSHAAIYCTPGLGDCDAVNTSRWSELWGIPIALFGMISYAALLVLVFWGSKISLVRDYNNLFIFGIGTFGFLFSLYLTYLELFVIQAICQWCLVSAICMAIIFIASIIRLKSLQHQQKAKRRSK